MKKLLYIALVAMLPVISVAQRQVEWKNFMVSDTLTADTNVVIPTSGIYSSWNAFFVVGTTTATTTSCKVQVSPNNQHWLDYPDMDSVVVTSGQSFAFEDTYVSLRWMRFQFKIQAGTSLPISAWYVFKAK